MKNKNLNIIAGIPNSITDPAEKIAYKYIHGLDEGLTDNQSIKDLAEEIRQYSIKVDSAAPEMLDALINVVTICDVKEKNRIYGNHPNHWTNKILNAIKKATK